MDYGEALSKALLFYRAQQSGSPSTHRLAWSAPLLLLQ